MWHPPPTPASSFAESFRQGFNMPVSFVEAHSTVCGLGDFTLLEHFTCCAGVIYFS